MIRPNINFYDSYEKVESEITAPGSIADVMYDEAANQREQEDAEESNGDSRCTVLTMHREALFIIGWGKRSTSFSM